MEEKVSIKFVININVSDINLNLTYEKKVGNLSEVRGVLAKVMKVLEAVAVTESEVRKEVAEIPKAQEKPVVEFLKDIANDLIIGIEPKDVAKKYGVHKSVVFAVKRIINMKKEGAKELYKVRRGSTLVLALLKDEELLIARFTRNAVFSKKVRKPEEISEIVFLGKEDKAEIRKRYEEKLKLFKKYFVSSESNKLRKFAMEDAQLKREMVK